MNNTLYHIRAVWRVDNTFDVYIAGILKVDNQQTFADMTSGINQFDLSTYGDSEDYFYIDAYGDPDNDVDYTIGDNLVPVLEINESIQEVDRWEFCLDDSTKEFREIGSCLLYTSPSPRDRQRSRMPSSA